MLCDPTCDTTMLKVISFFMQTILKSITNYVIVITSCCSFRWKLMIGISLLCVELLKQIGKINVCPYLLFFLTIICLTLGKINFWLENFNTRWHALSMRCHSTHLLNEIFFDNIVICLKRPLDTCLWSTRQKS